MKTDLFISYAWTSEVHREWVRLLANQLHLIGYTIKIDEVVDYGSSLSGFMREVTEAKHVLLIVDENYVERANNQPYSGVGIESTWISEAFTSKPATWLSVLFVRNPDWRLPEWLKEYNPKGFDFNSLPNKNEFPGAVQIDAIWRWIEDLPADKTHAVPLSVVHKRAARLERIDVLADPGNYVNPALDGRVTFYYKEHSHYTVGNGEYQFKIKFSGRSNDSVYLYTDGGLKAVGLITSQEVDPNTVESFLTQGRTITPKVGQRAILLNTGGALCVLTIDEVQSEVNEKEYIPEHVTFTYQVLKNY
ncbi:toll/interleukin-1 receptor domain-containing protein [Vibrio gallicus]|uniref:toll/interleukin-1 receptor domain-containing protein n=1 Tax=Vibrio gallicus TaxID=190897 RepID=UPI0021C3FCF4|nr:toll/interleukin-1 receptor domain-containing protein [Vibrio gallicus]